MLINYIVIITGIVILLPVVIAGGVSCGIYKIGK